jgi:hypothetical protein
MAMISASSTRDSRINRSLCPYRNKTWSHVRREHLLKKISHRPAKQTTGQRGNPAQAPLCRNVVDFTPSFSPGEFFFVAQSFDRPLFKKSPHFQLIQGTSTPPK